MRDTCGKSSRFSPFPWWTKVLVCLALWFAVLPACGAQETEAIRVQRLADLGKVWTIVKHTHPYLAYRQDIDWDQALVLTLPKVRAARSQQEYLQTLDYMLAFLNDPATRIIRSPRSPLSPDATGVAAPRSQESEPTQPYLRWVSNDLAVIVATDYRKLDSRKDLSQTFRRLFREATKADAVLLDIRSLNGSASWGLGVYLEQTISSLLPIDIELAPQRFVHSFGYLQQSEGTSGTYYSELVTRSRGVIRGDSPVPNRPRHLGFLLNAQSADLTDILLPMQEKGLAVVVLEGDSQSPDSDSSANVIEIGDGIRLRLRHSESLSPSGATKLTPDVVTPRADDPEQARRAGMQALRNWKPSKLASAIAAKGPAGEPGRRALFVDQAYREMTYPEYPYRMLALFRLWGVINHFFAYKELMDQTWDKTLVEFIPKMETARNATEYALAIAEMTTRIQDSHGMITGKILDDYFGTYRPPVRVDTIQGETVITEIDDSLRGKTELMVGDILRAVDGEEIGTRRERLARYLPASTPGRLRNKVDMFTLLGPQHSAAVLRVTDRQGTTKEVTVPRTAEPLARTTRSRPLPIYGVLPDGYGYIDLDRLTTPEVEAAFNAVQNTPGLILDMRGYPLGGSFGLASRLAREKKVAAQFEFPEWEGSNGSFLKRSEQQFVFPAGGTKYNGQIAVLINEGAQSAAEHSCLHLEAATHVTFIGAPTSGANGNVSYVYLPGGITVRFTGLAVRHGDGRQLQRVGIQPDIRVEPTIEGIRQGRDEVLERAIQFLRSGG